MSSKKTAGIIILLLLTLFILLACDKKSDKTAGKENIESVSVNTDNGAADKNTVSSNSKNVYINAKFAYRIEYPNEWINIIESETQDGALIYYKDGNDVRTFCGKAPDGYIDLEREQYKDDGKKVEDFSTDDGVKGIIVTGDYNKKKLMHITVTLKGNHYDVYALVSSDFYKNNQSNIEAMGKSIKVLN